jgi:hypothetical protein
MGKQSYIVCMLGPPAIPGAEFYTGFSIPMETEVLINPNDVFQDFPPTKFYMPVSETLWNIAKQVCRH